LGFSYCVSSGNELDFDLADYLEFLVADAHTKIIVCLARHPRPGGVHGGRREGARARQAGS